MKKLLIFLLTVLLLLPSALAEESSALSPEEYASLQPMLPDESYENYLSLLPPTPPFSATPAEYENALAQAQQGDTESQFFTGFCLLLGEGVAPDSSQAAYWFALAMEQGHSKAAGCLGHMYLSGQGVPQDSEAAAECFRRGADGGDPGSQFQLGELYYFGDGVEQDYEKAVHWHDLAARQSFAPSCYILANIYFYGDGTISRDMEKAYTYAKLGAESGVGMLQTLTGDYCYLFSAGNGPEEALKWYQLAAEQGEATAFGRLACIYHDGIIVQQDDEKMFQYALQGADAGDATSIAIVMDCYYYGWLVEKDWEKAFQYALMGAELNNLTCQSMVAEMYLYGEGTPVDEEQYVFWADSAARGGSSLIALNLALYYNERFDIENTIFYLTLSAEAGNSDACYILGDCYADGTGVEQDPEKAAYWYDQGDYWDDQTRY